MTPEHVKYIVIHCSATRVSQDIGAREITVMHRRRGWRTIGYHRVIRRNGAVERGRPFSQMGAHVKGYNSKSVGICMVGGVDHTGAGEMNFTAPQFQSLQVLIEDTQLMFSGAQVVGHRDLSPDRDGDGVVERHEWLKECPCFSVDHFMRTGEAVYYV